MLEAFESTSPATVAFIDRDGTTRCLATRFHWNGSEIVVCGDHDVAWSGVAYQSVALSIGPTSGDDSTEPHLEVVGRAVVDRVIGCAPEYRAAAVRCLGRKKGNELSDQIPPTATMYRMFISPCTERTRSIDLRS